MNGKWDGSQSEWPMGARMEWNEWQNEVEVKSDEWSGKWIKNRMGCRA